MENTVPKYEKDFVFVNLEKDMEKVISAATIEEAWEKLEKAVGDITNWYVRTIAPE